MTCSNDQNCIGLKNPASYSIQFGYDPQGNRWKQATTESGTTETRTFLYDREDILAEYTDELLTVRKAMYIHGPGIDETLALVSPNGEVFVVLHDGLGSVTGLVDQRGGFVNDYDYAAFGQRSVNSGRDTIENRFMYTNREHVESGPNDSELYDYRARYYRPDLGRFISMDPLGMVDGTNQFGYVRNSPVEFTDPFGYKVFRCCRNVQVNRIIDGVSRILDLKHCWIKTDSRSGGMGPANGGPLPACPLE